MAATSESPFTLLQVEEDILKFHHLLASSPRSNPHRRTHYLLRLSGLLSERFTLSRDKGDLDKGVVHLTEAVLLQFRRPGKSVVDVFLSLTDALFSRFSFYKQTEDIKSLVKYFRFIRTNFHIIEASKMPHHQFVTHMIEVLAANLRFGSGDMIQDMEEMAALTHELLSLDVLTTNSMLIHDIGTFSVAVSETFYLDDANLPPEKVIQVLREVEMVLPDSHISVFGFTLPQIDKLILKYHHLLTSSPRSDPLRPTLLRRLAVQRNNRYVRFDDQRNDSDLDKSISDLTEAVLLQFGASKNVVHTFFELANVLLSRFFVSKQTEDVKSSIKYYRFLRNSFQDNFHPLEAFDIPRGQLMLRLVRALAENLILGFGDVMQDMEEMATISSELLCSTCSRSDLIEAVNPFFDAVTKRIHVDGVTQPADHVIEVLREAVVLIPESRVSRALATCLAARFMVAHVIKDYEEAITIADKVIAAHSSGDSLTPSQRHAISLIMVIVTGRLKLHLRPEYLEDAVRRYRALLDLPFLPDQLRIDLAHDLDHFERQRFSLFGVAGNPGETRFKNPTHVIVLGSALRYDPEDDETAEKVNILQKILTALCNGETMDVEADVELSRRTIHPSEHSNDQLSYMHAIMFADILEVAHERTNRLDYLNEAITAYREVRKMSTQKAFHFHAGWGLLDSLIARHLLLDRRQDYEEGMQLFPELVNDGSGEVFNRCKISCTWARSARINAHPSTSTAYKTAMSLLQDTLVFSPTLQTQHFLLQQLLRREGVLPSDYASYLIEIGQSKHAIETLERGRALLWSEMRGFRTSADQLQAAHPALADKLVDINRRLESVTMSVAQSESKETGGGGTKTGAGTCEGTDSIGLLATTQRRLLEERETLISRVKSFPDFENFLKPPSFDALNLAAAHGPVIIINQSEWRSDIIILLKDMSPSIISAPFYLQDRANRLKNQLLRARKESGLDSKDYDLTLASVLSDLYKLVGKAVIERLRQLKVPNKSRVWWCPTSAFCSLPLHAMGPIVSDDGKEQYFSDLYITSYTPTLSTLIESRKPRSIHKTLDEPSLLLVAQPDTLPGAWSEIGVIQSTETLVTTLVSAIATPKTVVEFLRDHQFAHFVCHGLLEPGKPFDASFELHGGNLTLLEMVRSQLPAAEFAFLSACHTAELTEDSNADEGLHLAAAMQYCGFRSVVGTMWAMADTDGADLSKYFYKSIFSESKGREGMPYYERSAKALQVAVKKLRRKRGMTLERWVNFVHYGA